ncbi:GMP synthase [Candidatus Roizmanbacteria bacterium CG10_big_fil_rev_8_21_14_0_10_39_6]|uniref:GMP synthase n=1 Tax=Candidatus Roizmanbacteria bacterium CG10_big_fil_rev_8_21_14_0_10_39_6 TaxID=1974853 RepID=A0A2M8KTA8_9BACT|nr:MAG: GMP synthase [Candidatus Roizmanbacteria bacterium CG10_big_fil_rev_8_21_14_0_10_39_6]
MPQYTANTYKKHLEKEHRLSPFSTYLKEIVYGANDGIITTFAVVAGFTGAQAMGSNTTLPFLTVLLFGIANLFADGASMSLGNFLSIRADQDVFRSEKEKELHEIRNSTKMEEVETIHILQTKGFNKKDAQAITNLYKKNEAYWVEFMMKDELEMTNPEGEIPMYNALATFLAFISFGIIPLLPYFFSRSVHAAFLFSSTTAFLALVLLGFLRWRVTKRNILNSIGEVILVGGIAALIAYVVGTLIHI